MNLWERVQSGDMTTFDWKGEGFCLKPLQSSGGRGILIWRNGRTKLRKSEHIGGISTRTRIEESLDNSLGMYYQPYIKPMKSPQEQPMAHHLYFLYDIKNRQYSYVGGLWLARPNLKIQGASDTTYGSLEVN
jgi:hypothetical protein